MLDPVVLLQVCYLLGIDTVALGKGGWDLGCSDMKGVVSEERSVERWPPLNGLALHVLTCGGNWLCCY